MSALGGGGETAAQHRVSLFPPIFWMHATLNLQFLTRSSLQATESYGAQRGKESGGIASHRTAWFPIADPGQWGEPDNNSPTKMTQATHRSRDYPIQADLAESHGQTRVSDGTLGSYPSGLGDRPRVKDARSACDVKALRATGLRAGRSYHTGRNGRGSASQRPG